MWKGVYIVDCEVINKSEIIGVLVRHTAKYVSLKGILTCIDFFPFYSFPESDVMKLISCDKNLYKCRKAIEFSYTCILR